MTRTSRHTDYQHEATMTASIPPGALDVREARPARIRFCEAKPVREESL